MLLLKLLLIKSADKAADKSADKAAADTPPTNQSGTNTTNTDNQGKKTPSEWASNAAAAATMGVEAKEAAPAQHYSTAPNTLLPTKKSSSGSANGDAPPYTPRINNEGTDRTGQGDGDGDKPKTPGANIPTHKSEAGPTYSNEIIIRIEVPNNLAKSVSGNKGNSTNVALGQMLN